LNWVKGLHYEVNALNQVEAHL